MSTKVTKRKGKIRICEKLQLVEEKLEESQNILQLIKKEPTKKEEENGPGQDLGEADSLRS